MSLTGLFIVFVTFVVKEGLAERWKEKADAIYQARYVFDIQQSEDSLKTFVTEQRYEANFDKLDDAVRAGNTDWEHRINIEWQQFDVIAEQISAVESKTKDDLNRIRALMETLRHNTKAEEDVQKLKTDSSSFDSEVHQTQNLHQQETKSSDRHGKPFLLRQHTLTMVLRRQMNGYTAAFHVQYGGLCDRVRKDALDLQENLEGNAEAAWWIAAWLYAVGWVLAVVGRFYDVPMAAD
jgi:prophage DNA circulation protein